LEKSAPRKSYLPKTFASQNSIEEDNLQFFTLFFITFLLANFSHFAQQFQNQRQILRCFNTHIKIL
jgi:hypothetical protein